MVMTSLLLTLVTLMGACEVRSRLSPAPRVSAVKADVSGPAAGLEKLGEAPEAAPKIKLQFASELRGWAASDKKIWLTEDGGRNWALVYSFPTPDGLPPHIPASQLKDVARFYVEIRQLMFTDAASGFLLTSDGLYKTTDAGRSWLHVTTPLDAPGGLLLGSAFLKGGEVGWVAGATYRPASQDEILRTPNNMVSPDGKSILYRAIFQTRDGGATWKEQRVESGPGRFSDIYILDAEHGWALGDSDNYFWDSGSGRWKVSDSMSKCVGRRPREDDEAAPASIFFIDPTTGWLSDTRNHLAKSTDGGRNWCTLPDPAQEPVTAFYSELHFTDAARGWALQEGGILYKTTDGGVTWKKVSDLKFNDLYFLDGTHGWAIGAEGLFRILS